MITKFKLFENKQEPQVGDWCLMTNWWAGQHIHDFINNTPAQIIRNNVVKFDKPFLIDADPLHPGKDFKDKFENGKQIGSNYRDWIRFYSTNKEDVLAFINTEKYNL